MTTKTERKKKRSRKLGFTREETKDVVFHLNQLLANYHIHYQKLRNYHWNVKGDDFFDLHELTEEQYNKAKENIDEIAERIRVFGHTPLSTLKDYLETSEIEETGTGLSGEEIAEEILTDYTMLISFMVDVTDEASSIGDVGTTDMMDNYIKSLEKDHWMLAAWLDKA